MSTADGGDTHTPLPWEVKTIEWKITAGMEFSACDIQQAGVDVPRVICGVSRKAKLSHEDAAYIVQACNAYPALVEACKHAQHKIEQTLAGEYPNGEALQSALADLRAALAQAGVSE